MSPDLYHRTRELTDEVRGLRKAIRTTKIVAVIAVVGCVLSLGSSGGTIASVRSDQNTKADVDDLEAVVQDLDKLIGGICPLIGVIIFSPPRPDFTAEQLRQRELFLVPSREYYQQLRCEDR